MVAFLPQGRAGRAGRAGLAEEVRYANSEAPEGRVAGQPALPSTGRRTGGFGHRWAEWGSWRAAALADLMLTASGRSDQNIVGVFRQAGDLPPELLPSTALLAKPGVIASSTLQGLFTLT